MVTIAHAPSTTPKIAAVFLSFFLFSSPSFSPDDSDSFGEGRVGRRLSEPSGRIRGNLISNDIA